MCSHWQFLLKRLAIMFWRIFGVWGVFGVFGEIGLWGGTFGVFCVSHSQSGLVVEMSYEFGLNFLFFQ